MTEEKLTDILKLRTKISEYESDLNLMSKYKAGLGNDLDNVRMMVRLSWVDIDSYIKKGQEELTKLKNEFQSL